MLPEDSHWSYLTPILLPIKPLPSYKFSGVNQPDAKISSSAGGFSNCLILVPSRTRADRAHCSGSSVWCCWCNARDRSNKASSCCALRSESVEMNSVPFSVGRQSCVPAIRRVVQAAPGGRAGKASQTSISRPSWAEEERTAIRGAGYVKLILTGPNRIGRNLSILINKAAEDKRQKQLLE